MYIPTATCIYLLQHVYTYCNMYIPTATCIYLLQHVYTYCNMRKPPRASCFLVYPPFMGMRLCLRGLVVAHANKSKTNIECRQGRQGVRSMRQHLVFSPVLSRKSVALSLPPPSPPPYPFSLPLSSHPSQYMYKSKTGMQCA